MSLEGSSAGWRRSRVLLPVIPAKMQEGDGLGRSRSALEAGANRLSEVGVGVCPPGDAPSAVDSFVKEHPGPVAKVRLARELAHDGRDVRRDPRALLLFQGPDGRDDLDANHAVSLATRRHPRLGEEMKVRGGIRHRDGDGGGLLPLEEAGGRPLEESLLTRAGEGSFGRYDVDHGHGRISW